VFGGGVVSGVLNTLAGGGGLIALPLLILTGLPASVANGTYRLAVVGQNVAAMAGFQRRGVRVAGDTWPLQIPCILGAAAGVGLALLVDESAFRRFVAVLLVLMLIPMFRKSRRAARDPAERFRIRGWMWPAYFAVGVYGGFLQVGVGFLFLALLRGASGLDLVRANAVKVFLVLGYSVLAVILFTAGNRMVLAPALALAAGNAAGGWMGAHLAVTRGEGWIRWVVTATVLASAAKLLGAW